MMAKFHRQSILTGCVDSYCLVCESHLRSEDDINGHIAKPIHKKNLDATPYVDKFKDDCVRKVKKGYFCEFCNMLLSTAAKVGLHISEAKHFDNKGSQLLKRVGNHIGFVDILINEKAWNGFIDETCVICNTEFPNENIHKTEPTHILNLIQNKVEFGPDKAIYRKVDETSYQCLTCNTVLAPNALATHFDQNEHKKFLFACTQAQSQTQVRSEVEPEISKPEVNDSGMKIGNVVNKKPEANVKRTKIETSVDSNKKSAKVETKKFENDVKKPETVQCELQIGTIEMDEQLCKSLGAKDYIADDEHGKKLCILCDWTMDGMILSSHVYGRHHQTMLKMHKERMEKKLLALQNKGKVKETEVEIEFESDVKEQENKDKIIDSVPMFYSNDIIINILACIVYCKKCSKNIDFVYEVIEAHIEDHKKEAKTETVPAPTNFTEQKVTEMPSSPNPGPAKMKRKDSDDKSDTRASSAASTREIDEEVEKFAKLHDLAYSRNDNKVYCRVCDTRVPSSLKNMKEHVYGSLHKNRAANILKQRPAKPVMVKKPLDKFIDSIVAVENDCMKDVIINERFCINILSFLMITYELVLRCEPCQDILRVEHLDLHKASVSHMRAMADVPVIASMESEFVREVRPGVYHCGFCNNCHQDMDELESHFKSTLHREAKTSSSWRLQHYMPEVLANRERKQLEIMMLMNMMMSGNPF